MLALTAGYGPALGVLAVPGAAALALLFWLRARVPDPIAYEPAPAAPCGPQAAPGRLPRAFWTYATFTALTMTGFATFGVLSFHLVQQHLTATAVVPVLYAVAMGVDALAALATGWLYDRSGTLVLAALPVMSAAVPLLAFSNSRWPAVAGALAWGAAVGIQESTLRATVADLVPVGRRATAYGLFAGIMGAATLAGGALTGILYDYSIPALVITVAAIQAVALALLWFVRNRRG
jgi:predicted MFS family arabinose efflux permease